MKKLFIALGLLVSLTLSAQTNRWDSLKNEINFFMANDLGRNGYYEQKPIARLMGEMAEAIGPEAVLAAGDVHHFDGVASTQDPLWISNYEAIYDHPELMISWLPILGNHEYRGNTQAVIDYSKVSRRWEMPARYYTKSSMRMEPPFVLFSSILPHSLTNIAMNRTSTQMPASRISMLS